MGQWPFAKVWGNRGSGLCPRSVPSTASSPAMVSLTVVPESIPTPTPLQRFFHRLVYRDRKSLFPAVPFVNCPRFNALSGCFIPSTSSQNKGVINRGCGCLGLEDGTAESSRKSGDRKRFYFQHLESDRPEPPSGGLNPPDGHFKGPCYWLNRTTGRTRILDLTTEDHITPEGRRQPSEQFVSAATWVEERGAKVILLAAGTKRLFWENGAELKRIFPEVLITISDNGTMIVLPSAPRKWPA